MTLDDLAGRGTISLQEFSVLAGTSTRTLYKVLQMENHGGLPVRRLGGRWRCPVPLVREWLGAQHPNLDGDEPAELAS